MPVENVGQAGIGIDTSDFRKFARALTKAAPLIAGVLRVNLRGVGDVVAEEARSLARPYSSTIPDSIKVRVSGATVSVLGGGTGVPLGGLFELGNVNSKDSSEFRHPVFGNRNVWASQPMHPFLLPALANKIDAAEAAATAALDIAIDEAVHG